MQSVSSGVYRFRIGESDFWAGEVDRLILSHFDRGIYTELSLPAHQASKPFTSKSFEEFVLCASGNLQGPFCRGHVAFFLFESQVHQLKFSGCGFLRRHLLA